MEINLVFLDKYNKLKPNVDYSINVTQQGEKILESNNVYSEKGLSTLITRPLNSEEPVSIKVLINQIGIENGSNSLESDGEILEFTVVPEFGSMTIILFGITISMLILLNAKNKLFVIKLK